MKYIMILEDFYFDKILDKISKSGYDSLSKQEKEYLDKYSNGSHSELKKDLEERHKRYQSSFDYDPRNDEFFSGMSDLLNWTDAEIEDGRYNIIWNELDERDQEEFFNDYKVDNRCKDLPWENLTPDIITKFKKFADQYR